MAMKTYNRGPCPVCGRSISNAGFAEKAHEDAHIRRGEMVKVWRWTWQGEQIADTVRHVAPKQVRLAEAFGLFPTFEACREYYTARKQERA